MRFAHESRGWLFLFLPFLLLWMFAFARWQRKVRRQWAEDSLLAHSVPGFSKGRLGAKEALKILALPFAILALIEPQWGFRDETVQVKGADIMVLADVSNSMLAQDLAPSRLEQQRRKLNDLLKLLAGDRVGLIAFAGGSFLLSPLTADYDTLRAFVDDLSVETIPVQGTDLSGALGLAMKAMNDPHASKAILLLSDGEDHSERLEKSIRSLKEKHIRVFVLGLGTPEGAPIPELSGGFKTDFSGQRVLSRLNETALKDLALQTGGAYRRAQTGDEDLRRLYLQGIREVSDLRELSVSQRRVWETRYLWPLGAAFALLWTERCLSESRQKPKTARAA